MNPNDSMEHAQGIHPPLNVKYFRRQKPVTFDQLRERSEIRAIEWRKDSTSAGVTSTIEFATIELAGEVGELCNAIKKKLRAQDGLPGGVTDDTNIIEELADVVICADLLARKLGINLGQAVVEKFNKTSEKFGFETKWESEWKKL